MRKLPSQSRSKANSPFRRFPLFVGFLSIIIDLPKTQTLTYLIKVEDVENQQFFEGEENSMTMSRFVAKEIYFIEDNISVYFISVYHGHFSLLN